MPATNKSENRSFALRAVDEHLIMLYNGESVPLEPRGGDAFLVHHPHFELFLLEFGRTDDADGPVCEAFYGGEWFRGARFTGQTHFTVPEHWQAFTGHYRMHNILEQQF